MDQIIVVRQDGQVLGYNSSWDFLHKKSRKPAKLDALAPLTIKTKNEDPETNDDVLNELLQRKNFLLDKLNAASASQNSQTSGQQRRKQLIAPDTKIYSSIRYNFEKGYAELVLSTKNSTVIHGVVAKSQHIFEKEIISQ